MKYLLFSVLCNVYYVVCSVKCLLCRALYNMKQCIMSFVHRLLPVTECAVFAVGEQCVFIPSPVREGSTFLVIIGVQLFQTELKLVRKVSADANLKRYQHTVEGASGRCK